MKMKTISIFLFCLAILACVTAPLKEEVDKIGYGEPLTIDYQKAIKAYFDEALVDPYSAVIKVGNPYTGSIRTSLIEGRQVIAGYMVPAKVNAKNRMGGYVGSKNYLFIFRNDQLIKVLTPDELDLMRYK